MFSLDWDLLLQRKLPWYKRLARFISWQKALFTGIKVLYGWFITYKDDTFYRLSITSQIIYLEKLLNDKFNEGLPARADSSTVGLYDGAPTGIFISDPSDAIFPQYIWNKIEQRPKTFLYNKSESGPKTYLYNISEIDGEYDFIIKVPIALGDVTTNALLVAQIKAQVNIYRIAGKRFNIVNY